MAGLVGFGVIVAGAAGLALYSYLTTSTTNRDRSSSNSKSRSVEPPPQAVQSFKSSVDPHVPSVTLSWECPKNCHYQIRYRKRDDRTPYQYVSTSSTQQVFTCGGTDKTSSLEPLTTYIFEVRAKGQSGQFGEWSGVECYIDWYCQLPGCKSNRISQEVPFCSKLHKWEFDSEYCVYPGCTRRKQCQDSTKSTHNKFHFCSNDHCRLAKRDGMTFLIHVDKLSDKQEFKSIEKQFKESWSHKRGKCPTVQTILAVINQSVKDRLNRYVHSLPPKYQKTEQFFHGTELKCLIDQYQVSCNAPDCGVCGIARRGFVSDRITSRWQRFGQAFYFAPNSSKCHWYSTGRENSGDKPPPNKSYWGMLLCEVAPGRKYTIRPKMYTKPIPKEPPNGYHSVYGKSKSFFHDSDLNFDELVVYTEDAIAPQYIILYS